MIDVSILGYGNVARHLEKAFANSDAVRLQQIYSRTKSESEFSTTDLNALVASDVYIIAVSDDAISTLSNQLQFENKLVVHTSGSLPLSELNSKNRRGVFYPLQTFSKSREVNWETIPICIETENASDLEMLRQVAGAISNSVYEIDSEQRRALHVAAVFASNFTNHLCAIANDICTQHKIPFEILKPLILETAQKISTLSPTEAQTGPAIRRDQSTINAHLNLLTDSMQVEIYKILTKSIQHDQKL